MPIKILPYAPELAEAIAQFNSRLAAGGLPEELRLPTDGMIQGDGRRTREEFFLAMENGFVRGGYFLVYQPFAFSGDVQEVAHYRLPLSEGVVNKTYGAVAAQMLRRALRDQPLLFGLGMGGLDRPLPRMLQTAGWSLYPIPFYFYVAHPVRFLHNIRAVRKNAGRKLLLDLAAISGAGWLGLRAMTAMRRARQPQGITFEIEPQFCDWCDRLWNYCKPGYQMVGVRDAAYLNRWYPTQSQRYIRLRILRNGQTAGWALVLDTAMQKDPIFGNLRVGSIVDCLATPDQAAAVIEEVRRFLCERGVDLIVSNQSHAAWTGALRDAGFLRGPSNFIFAASKHLTQRMGPFDENQSQIHINRGDGDGPIHL